MEPDEWDLWVARNPRHLGAKVADRPCADCPLGFAAEMRAIGRCNGEPQGHEEESDVNVTGIEVTGAVTQERRIEVLAPCGTCLHRQVCGLKDKLEAAGEADVTMARLPDELHLVLQARVECAFYARDKAAGKPASAGDVDKPKRGWSPEQRAAAAERMRQRNATRGEGAAA